MNNDNTPPFYTDFRPQYHPLPDDLSEGPWTTLVMSLLMAVAVVLIAAGAYAGGV